MPEPQGAPLLGGKYRLLRELGAGAAATVFEAEHALVGKRVAVKVLDPVLARHPVLRARFLAEARAAATLSHPHVVDIHDIGMEGTGACFMVMELLEGETLEAMLSARGAIPVPYACELGLQVLSALEAAHLRGIVHRDLKTANVIVTHPRPDRPLVKVLDFGIAKGVIDAALDTVAEGTLLGSPRTMAPEQALGRDVDERADLYAFGAVMFEMLCGAPAFPGNSAVQVIGNVIAGRRARLRDLAPRVPAELAELIERCLAVCPDDRPESASEVARALMTFVSRQYVTSLPAGGVSLEPIPLKRKPPTRSGTMPITIVQPAVRLDDFAGLDLTESSVPPSSASVSTSLLEHPRIPKAPTPVRISAEALGLPPCSPLPVPEELAARRAPTVTPQSEAPAPAARATPRRLALSDVLPAAAAGLAMGLAVAWAAGILQ